MTDVQFSRNCRWMTGECLKLNTQLDFKQYQMIWNCLKWWLRVQNCQIDWKLNIQSEFHHTSFEMNKSRSEANREIEHHQWVLMIYISVSQHCLTNTRTLICLCKRINVNFIQQKSNTLHIFKKQQRRFILLKHVNFVCLQYSTSEHKRLNWMNRFLENKEIVFRQTIDCVRQSCLWLNHIHCW